MSQAGQLSHTGVRRVKLGYFAHSGRLRRVGRDADTAFEDALDLATLAGARLSVVSVPTLPEPPTEVETQASIEMATRHYE